MIWNHAGRVLMGIRSFVVAQKWAVVVVGLLISILALLVAVLAARPEIGSWSGYDWIRPDATKEDVRILVATLNADPSGKHNAELENALRGAQQRFRRLGRPWNPSEEERLDVELERKSITRLLRRHNSEILVHGFVGMTGVIVMLVPAELNQPSRRYTVLSGDDFRRVADDIEPILVDAVQARIERDKWTIAESERHELLDSQVEDLLRQTQSEKSRREVLFQSAFTKDKLAFWRNDRHLAEESARIYEELLSNVVDPKEEAILRINLGLYFQTEGQRHRSEANIKKSTEHLSKAEELVERLPDIRRWVKVRNLQSTNDIWLYHITKTREYLGSAIKRQLETAADAVGWLTPGEALLVEQEMVGAEIMLAYETKDHLSLHYFYSVMQRNREQWYRWAEKAGTHNSPWVQALIECTAVQLIDRRGLERELNKEASKGEKVTPGVVVTWTNGDIRERRSRAEFWLEAAKNGAYVNSYNVQLGRVADLSREEALRTHDVELLSRSLDLTREFRVLEEVESGTIPFDKLDLNHPTSETVFKLESILTLACADRSGIQNVLSLLNRGESACGAAESLCASEMGWIRSISGALEYGLKRWEEDEGVQTGDSSEMRRWNAGGWAEPYTHAIWLRWRLRELPADGQSFCPSRVPWVE